MLKNILPILLIMIGTNVHADGGGSSAGPSVCSYGQFTCVDSEPPARIAACPFKDWTYVVISDGNSSKLFKIPSRQVPFPPGQGGVGVEFTGRDIDLKIQTGVPQGPLGWSSMLTIPRLLISHYKLGCSMNRH